MRMACHRHSSCRVVGVNELAMASPLSGHPPALVVQPINDVANLQDSEHDQLRAIGQITERQN